MTFETTPNYYEILEISPNATPQQIREAYLTIKSTYQKEHLALYSLFSAEEREVILKMTEEAYSILSDVEKRREYDKKFIPLDLGENPFLPLNENSPEKSQLAEVYSIDRVPPMETLNSGEEALIPPTTDIPISIDPSKKDSDRPRAPTSQPNTTILISNESHQETSMDYLSQRTIRPNVSPLSSNLLNEIEAETEWSGAFLQKIRFAQNVSLEEMVESTKISKNYLIAIEEENFGKLPAPVFVRGFIIQVARVLKLPQQKVAQGFLNRYNHARSKA